jgi:hypothetical protein
VSLPRRYDSPNDPDLGPRANNVCVIDQEPSDSLQIYYKAWHEHVYDPERRKPGAVVPSIDERFLAAIDSARAEDLLRRVHALHAEAGRVPDPGGPLDNYIRALDEWAHSHPEVDPQSVHWITTRLIRSVM